MFSLPSFPFCLFGILSLTNADAGVEMCVITGLVFALSMPIVAVMLWTAEFKKSAIFAVAVLMPICVWTPYMSLAYHTSVGQNYLQNNISNDGFIPAYVFNDMRGSLYDFDYDWVRDSHGKPTLTFRDMAQECGAKIVSTRSTLYHTYLFMEVCPKPNYYIDHHVIYKVDAASFLISLNEATHADARQNMELKKETLNQNDFEASRPYQGSR